MTENVETADAPVECNIPHRIFMNHVEQFHGKHIASYISDQIFGAYRAAQEDVGDEGAEDEEPPREKLKPHEIGNKYQVIGTMKYRLGQKSEDVLYVVDDKDPENVVNEILNCGFAIYDITQDREEIPKVYAILQGIEREMEKTKEIGPKTFKKMNILVFILISNVMTWGATKPIDPDDPETPFNDTDYRKRKPHPNYQDQIACEREVILKGRKYKDKFKTYVICSGLTYGFEEQDFLFLFKMAWNNEKFIPAFLPANNIIPLIHIQDLAKFIHALIEMLPKKPHYILAVEQTPCKLKQIVRTLSKTMGTNRVKEVSKVEAFLYPNMTQEIFERYTVNLNMEPSYLFDSLGVEYKTELNFAENMHAIVNEFRTAFHFVPFRIYVHGPPAVGKTTLAKLIAETYGLQYITVQTMISETIQNLKDAIEEETARLKGNAEKTKASAGVDDEGSDENDEEIEEEEESSLEDLNEKLRDIEVTLADSDNGRLPDDYVVRLMKGFLASNACQNQGYVLDGFPKTMAQVKELFGSEAEGGGGEEEAGDEEGEAPASKVAILPTFVISLEANDEFLCERVMNLPEKDVQDTHYTEEGMLRRLKTFRNNNTEDSTILNFFDEHEIHPMVYNVMEMTNLEHLFAELKLKFGRPIGFPLMSDELQQLSLQREELERMRKEEERLQAEIEEHEALEEYQLKMEEKIRILTELQYEEEKLLAAQCEPLRTYLMNYIFPTLTEGLLEVARLKPHDPVDYLAEYLFRNNPEGRMFDPSYTREGEMIDTVVKAVISKPEA